MKVAVTGASGFVGRHVLAELERRGCHVVAARRPSTLVRSGPHRWVDCDIGATTEAFSLLGEPDILVHLAWDGLPNYRSLHHFENELPRQYSFLRQMIDGGLGSLVITGTCFEYGMQSGRMSEDLETRPSNPYAFAKDGLRRQLEFLQEERCFGLSWLRLFYMYGEGQAEGSLYPQLLAAIRRGDSVFRMSGGEQLRDFLPVEAVAQAIVDVAIGTSGAGIVNICSGQPTSVRGFVERVASEHSVPIQFDRGAYPYPDYEPFAFWGSRTRLDALLGRDA